MRVFSRKAIPPHAEAGADVSVGFRCGVCGQVYPVPVWLSKLFGWLPGPLKAAAANAIDTAGEQGKLSHGWDEEGRYLCESCTDELDELLEHLEAGDVPSGIAPNLLPDRGEVEDEEPGADPTEREGQGEPDRGDGLDAYQRTRSAGRIGPNRQLTAGRGT